MTVRELLARVDSRELTEWAAFFDVEPWGCAEEDWRMGTVAAVIANVNRDAKKYPKPFEASDFAPRLRRQEQVEVEQTPEDHARVLAQWANVLGGGS